MSLTPLDVCEYMHINERELSECRKVDKNIFQED